MTKKVSHGQLKRAILSPTMFLLRMKGAFIVDNVHFCCVEGTFWLRTMDVTFCPPMTNIVKNNSHVWTFLSNTKNNLVMVVMVNCKDNTISDNDHFVKHNND